MKIISSLLLFVLIFPGCKTSQVTKYQPVKEIAPGLLEGYLSKEEIPNSFTLVPPPPQEGSLAFALDQEYAKKAIDSRDSSRYSIAIKDAELHFPAAAKAFESTLNIVISETNTPRLYLLMRRVLTDAALSVYAAKNHYQRKRPFMINNTPLCTPAEEEFLRKDGSYPSGHTSIGWAWALILSEIFPSKSETILQRGYAFGESRVICNAHWHSDVEMGRIMGAAAVAKLHANDLFQKDLEEVKEEIKHLSIKN